MKSVKVEEWIQTNPQAPIWYLPYGNISSNSSAD